MTARTRVQQLRDALADRYRIEGELGRGGMATVYLAYDLRHDRRVAVKVLRPEVSAELATDRFLLEIRTTANLQHPHIVPVFDSGSADGEYYFVMPVVEGESLRARLDRDGPLPVAEAIRLVREVAGALDYAHQQGILHRDLKPENILLSRGHALLADFGIARAAGTPAQDRLTQTGTSIGTPAYMSPEQAIGDRELGPPSDVYGLAAILYELLTGEPPFTGATYEAILVKRLTTVPLRLRTRRSETPPTCDAAVARALASDPADRFATAADFAAAFGDEAPQATGPAGPSIAVLPFSNLSTDAENGYFADGLTEEIITTLSKVRSLRVISRYTVMQYRARTGPLPDIARDLGVTHLLEGSVRKGGDRLRVTATLIAAEGGAALWSERFDGTLADIFDMQDRTAGAIVSALEITLSGEEQSRLAEHPIEDPRAYDAYLKAREGIIAMTASGVHHTMEHLDEALRRAPENVFLIRAKALALFSMINLGISNDRSLLDQALRLADEIARLTPGSPYVAEIRGVVAAISGDLLSAVRECGIAYEAMPEDLELAFWYAGLLVYTGRPDAGLALLHEIRRLEPGYPPTRLMMVVGEQMRGHPERPLAEYPAGPGSAPPSYMCLVHGLLKLAVDDRPGAVEAFAVAHVDAPDLLEILRAFLAAAVQGDPGAPDLLTLEVQTGARQDASYAEMVAEGFALLGDAEEAARWLGRAVDGGFACYTGLAEHNALWRPWLNHPQLAPVFARMRNLEKEQVAMPLGPGLRALMARSG
jgi:eukaryotic-like serine/threonine-protein kinase